MELRPNKSSGPWILGRTHGKEIVSGNEGGKVSLELERGHTARTCALPEIFKMGSDLFRTKIHNSDLVRLFRQILLMHSFICE